MLLYLAWLQTLIATLGSLYFSEVMKLPPCTLCWYQRILMYPLLFILTVGIVSKDKKVHWYVLPLSISGLLVAIYHNLLYYKILPESAAPCTMGISCTTQFIDWFGFVTIPLLSLLAFAIVTVIMVFAARSQKNSNE